MSAALWLSLAACDGAAPEQPASPVSSLDAGVEGETIMSVQRGLEAHAIDLGDDHLHVELRQPDGRTAFAADFQPDGAHYRVSDALYAAGDSTTLPEPRREERLLPRNPEQLLTLKTAIEGTLFLHESLMSATNGNYAAQDHYGCDLGPLGRKSSCSDVGACCDAHDQCYTENHCTAASWGEKVDSVCQTKCNLQALSCVLLQTPKPGKSSCCDKNADYCGQYRVAGQPKPTTATPPNVPRWDGVEQWNGATYSSNAKPKPTASKPKSPTASKPKSPTASKPTSTQTASKPDAGTASTPASKQPSTERTGPTSASKADAGAPASKSDAGVRDGGVPDAGEDDDCDDEDDDDDCDDDSCDPDTDPFCDDDDDDAEDDADDDADDADDDADDADDDADDEDDDEDDYRRIAG